MKTICPTNKIHLTFDKKRFSNGRHLAFSHLHESCLLLQTLFEIGASFLLIKQHYIYWTAYSKNLSKKKKNIIY